MESRQQIREHYFSVITSWQQSGQNQKQFCLQKNIAYHVFHYWYKVYRNQASANNGSFVAVNLVTELHSNVELHLANGGRVVFHRPVSAAFLKVLIT